MSKIFRKALRICPAFLGAILVSANGVIASKAPAVETAQKQLIPATAQAINISSLQSIHRQTQKSDTLTQVSDLSQPSKEQLNITLPPYSFKASDLQLDTLYPVPEKSQYYLSNPTPKPGISEAVTQQLNQPENPPPNKNQYNLFNPTPRELMRDFSPGRPSKTDTPFTVDAGHYQIEADLVAYTRDTNNQTEAFQIFIPNIRVGLLNNVDFQISLQTYNNVRATFGGDNTQENSGFGDTTVGVRVNFWGNDSGTTAFGMVSFVKFPTNQNNLGNNSIEGGITFPLAIDLSEKWNVGIQTQFKLNKNEADSGYNAGLVNSIVLGYQATDRLGTYFELFTDITTERDSELVATFDTGITYLLTENLQLDAGVNIGLTRAADDFNPFVGFTVRF